MTTPKYLPSDITKISREEIERRYPGLALHRPIVLTQAHQYGGPVGPRVGRPPPAPQTSPPPDPLDPFSPEWWSDLAATLRLPDGDLQGPGLIAEAVRLHLCALGPVYFQLGIVKVAVFPSATQGLLWEDLYIGGTRVDLSKTDRVTASRVLTLVAIYARQPSAIHSCDQGVLVDAGWDARNDSEHSSSGEPHAEWVRNITGGSAWGCVTVDTGAPCPECNDVGTVTLFVSTSPCSTCAGTAPLALDKIQFKSTVSV